MSSDERVVAWLGDIVENIDRIFAHVDGLDRTAFVQDLKTRDAVERCLERVIEAAIRIGQPRMAKISPTSPFHQLRGLGNRLRHEYDFIDPMRIWDTISDELPTIRADCASAIGGLAQHPQK